MDTTIQPKMKPVSVQRVTDDIRALREGDVSQQQTLLTARAIADIFRGDTVSITNGTDAKYFDGDLVDLDRITDAGCRHIQEGSCINGPKYAVREEETGELTPFGGFLYTLSVLPTGELYWGSLEDPKAREDLEIAIRNPETKGAILDRPLPEHTPIRQLFYVANDDLDEPMAYTRMGVYEAYTTPAGTTDYRYKWGEWVTMNGQVQYIVVTDARMEEVVNPIVNSVYSVHTTIPLFALPDADLQKNGSTIRIIQHPDPNEDNRQLWATHVVYEHGEETDEDYEKMEITCTPAPRRNTVKVEAAYKEGLCPTEYVFEVAPRSDDVNGSATIIGKTWHLKQDADETEFTAGIVELLDAHTELGIKDIIDYANRKYAQDNGAYPAQSGLPLYINRSVGVDGYLKLNIVKDDVFEDNDWVLQIKRLDSRNPVNFVETRDLMPDPEKTYFTKVAYEASAAEGVFKIAVLGTDIHGCPTFDCTVTYYEIDESAEVIDLFTISSAGLTPGMPVKYQHQIFRNDVIYLVVTPGTSGHIGAREHIFPVLSFLPDPHAGSYISRDDLNQSAYTARLFEMMKEAGQLPAGVDPSDCPVSTEALILAYQNIASKLQAKGLLFGDIDDTRAVPNPDELVTSGIHWITGITQPSGYPEGLDGSAGARLVVFGQDYSTKEILHENDQYFVTGDTVADLEKTYYTRNLLTGEMTACVGLTDFAIGVTYYELDESKELQHDADVTQVLIQDTTIWMRTFKQATATWTPWACLTGGRTVKSYVSDDAYHHLSLDADTLRAWMMNGDLTLFCGVTFYSTTRSQLQQINLPAPSTLPFGKKLTLAINAAQNSQVRCVYTAEGESQERAYIFTYTGESGLYLETLELVSNGTHWYCKTYDGKFIRFGG